MQIVVDADACPNAIKEILFRVARRLQLPLVLVANQALHVPPSPCIRTIRVLPGFDVADDRILELVLPGDLVITGDIPLAARVLAVGAHALNPRGEFYTRENMEERLSMRNFMEGLRSSGIQTGGPAAMRAAERQDFANALDTFLARHSH